MKHAIACMFILLCIITIMIAIISIGNIKREVQKAAERVFSMILEGNEQDLASICTNTKIATNMIIRKQILVAKEEEFPLREEYILQIKPIDFKINMFDQTVYCYYQYIYSYKGKNEAGEHYQCYSRAEDTYYVTKKMDGKWIIVDFHEGP